MEDKLVTNTELMGFKASLAEDEKSEATIEKYMRSAEDFALFARDRAITKEVVLEYKGHLMQRYSDKTVNVYLAGVNRLLHYLGLDDCRVKTLKIQHQTYCPEQRQLTKGDYIRLLDAAKEKPQLRLIMETICGTGIRVSELQFFTREAVENGTVYIRLKGKGRNVLISGKLRKKLLAYCKAEGIKEGVIFRGKDGRPMDRSVIWARMKRLCKIAGVLASKVFPHNLRKLFARCFYKIEKDIAKLADILGHSSINTTRIYIMTTGQEHRRQIEALGLVQ